MESAVRDLLVNRALRLRPVQLATTVHGFHCLGIAARVPDIGMDDSREVYVWHVPADLLPLTEQELERWSVDAPEGRHWILSERELLLDNSQYSEPEIVLWGPEEVSLWIGRAVMSGELKAHQPYNQNENSIPIDKEGETHEKTDFLKPIIDVSNWLSVRGMEGATYTPVLLGAKTWVVTGDLEGPEGELERNTWKLNEDPWSSKIEIFDESERLENVPDLQVLSPPDDSWIAEENLPGMVGKLLEVRRQDGTTSSGENGPVRSMLLQRWSFRSDSARLGQRPLFLPGWIIHEQENILLHGRIGRTFELH
tara:strand:+ start:469 stop:1398 length:930 start_codon:yes stop_codon:yes gene_type:complete